MERGSGNKTKAELGAHLQDISVDAIVAVGESTGSDPSASEVKLLRNRFEDTNGLGRTMFPTQQDPA